MGHHVATEQVIRIARRHLLEFGECLPGMLQEPLAQSWQRSLGAGLQPIHTARVPEPLSLAELRQVRDQNHDLLAHAQPVMDYLGEQISQSHSMMVLADRDCTLLHTLGAPTFLEKAQRVALSPGASWHEHSRGTNAVGLALAEQKPIRVHGGEHFLERNGFLHCVAAPILSARGAVVGILDISGDTGQDHAHALGLVRTAARMIENRWIASDFRHHIRLHLHPQPQGLDTVAEGIVVASVEGILMGANPEAMRMLGLERSDLDCLHLSHLFELPWPRLLEQLQHQQGNTLRLRHENGQFFHARLRGSKVANPPAVWHTASTTAPSARQAAGSAGASTRSIQPLPPHRPAGDALELLDTGDSRWHLAAQKTRRVLDKPIALLIQGESGSGKELFARAAHESGPRKGQAFVAINCAAIPESLIEAELFGYAPGAFSGARREGSPGLLRQAHGGTLFLDEIGDMPLAMQARLLRVLQERQVTPLGGGRPVEVDFALISATHCQLKDAVARGQFRGDLYYRLNGLTVQLPALRERDDFGLLCAKILEHACPRQPPAVQPALLQALQGYHWPGNLRQLNSVLQTACAMLEPGETCIDWQHLADDVLHELRRPPRALQPPVVGGEPINGTTAAAVGSGHCAIHCTCDAPAATTTAAAAAAAFASRPLVQDLQSLSQQAIVQALQRTQGNMSEAARQLGISRQTLYRRLKSRSRVA